MQLFAANKILVLVSLALNLTFCSSAFASLTEELPAGKVLTDGTVAGEKEALTHFKEFEPIVYKRLNEMDKNRLRKAFGDSFVWFQRVGNYRKEQKCNALQKIQAIYDFAETDREKCISDIMKTDKK